MATSDARVSEGLEGAQGVRGVAEDRSATRSKDRVVRSSPWLASLRHEERSELLAAGRHVRLRRSESLLRAEDDLAVLVLGGTAVAAAIGRRGQPVIVSLLGPGAVAGLPVVLGQPDAGVQVTALSPLDGLVFRGSELRQRIGRQATLATACLRAVNAELGGARRDLASDADTSTSERIVDRLLQLADGWGEERGGEIHIAVPLTQDVLASWARASRESTGKALHELRNQGLIRTGRRSLTIVDRAGLEARRRTNEHNTEGLLRDLIGSFSG
jgi:CRP/FNR family transcriptional regulator, cyclic AMP receptor protein